MNDETIGYLKKWAIIFTPVIGVIAFIYSITFWNTFDINIFSFLSITEIINSFIFIAAISILPNIISMFLGFFVAHSTGRNKSKTQKKETKFEMIAEWFVLVISVVTFIFIFFFSKQYITRWIIGPVLLLFPLTKTMFYLLKFSTQNIINLSTINVILILLGSFLLLSAYGLGKYNSKRILYDKSFAFIKMHRYEIFKQHEVFNDTIKYIGAGGNFYFFISKDNKQKFIINKEQIPLLGLEQYTSPNSNY